MRSLITLSIAAVALFGCTKVIDVDLNEANEKYVIEANYSAEDSTVRVLITKTSSFFDNNASPKVNNATVTIVDALGTPTTVNFVGDGYYELTGYVPTFNSTYTLNVVADGNGFTADCYLPNPVELSPITYEYFPPFFGGEDGYAAYLNFNDPADTVNYYLIVLGKNSEPWDNLSDILSQDDQLTDGNFVERPMFGRELYQIDDTVHMELRSVEKRAYDYTLEAQSIVGSQSGAPGNPTNNWSGDALGFFNAYSSSRQTVVVQ